jgi:hypothetical protein
MKGFAEVQSGFLPADGLFQETSAQQSAVMLRAVLTFWKNGV